MKNFKKNTMAISTKLLCLLLLLTFLGCSGDSDPKDPGLSSKYKGTTTEAALSADNSNTLAVSAYDGSTLSYVLQQTSDFDKKKNQNSMNGHGFFPQVGQTVLQPVIFVKKTMNHSKTVASKPLARTDSKVIYGSDGGTASMTININEATGSFSGTVTYAMFSEDGVTLDGSSDISGQYSIEYEAISNFSFSFNALEFDFYSAETLTLTGTLDWDVDFSDNSENMTMNLVIWDEETEKTYWFDNYRIETIFYESGISQTISGRYYDFDNGFVDISTPESLFIYYDDSWPVEGVFRCDGKNGTWARLVFETETTWLQVDSDGNGGIDYEIEIAPEMK